MIRKFTPEKHAEQFNIIRNAYEKLTDSVYRAQHDAFLNHGDYINENYEIAEKYMDEYNFEMAIKHLKKILLMEPKLLFVQNKLGLCLTYNDQNDEAVRIFKELIKLDPDSALYHNNYAYVLKQGGEYALAEQILLKAHELNSVNFATIQELSDLYYTQNKPEKAILFLRKCMNKNKGDLESLLCYYFEMLVVASKARMIGEGNKVFEEIKRKYCDSEEKCKTIAFKFAKEAYTYYEDNYYDLAVMFLEKANELDPNNNDIQSFYKEAKEFDEAFRLYDKLKDDASIIPQLKGPIYYYIFASDYEKEELKAGIDKNLDAIDSYINSEPDLVIQCIGILKSNYYKLYEYKKNIYDEILQYAKNNKKVNEQWNELEQDNLVSYGIKKLVLLWLTYDISEEERDGRMTEVLDKLNTESSNAIISSIIRLRNRYSVLYDLNPETLEKFKKNLETQVTGNSEESVVKNNQYEDITSINSGTSTSRNTHTTNNSSNSGGAGCGTVIICAVIGGLIFPGVGVVIGIFVGLWIVGSSN